ncbi:hypothetical protein [Candidatus Uabimicrobium amorphum]|uniref:Uncharacterized protein n=1 Tax=Uabimicrobium amorphum TaxID=2596890 RepID=A0A5S9INC7_UABAM|nr:hypothetical protein [Candidatus Uabimicrobium amorphum]BBM85078.1 hypothetical protein UABAM_03441 [Candidatus Uabimicrobium amorphum]
MIIDIVILIVAMATGAAFAFAASYLKKTPLLIPVRSEDPVPVKVGAPIPFRLTTYGEIKDKTVHRPRLLLAMMVFAITILILKPIVNVSYSWNFIMMCSLFLICGLLCFIDFRSTITLIIFAGIPPFLLSIFGFDNYFWLVFSCGMIPGFKIGLDVANSYTSLMGSVEDKMKVSDNPYYQYYYLLLKWLPIVIVYQIACYCFPVIDIVNLLQIASQSFWKYPLILIVLILTMNLIWVVFPLYRETLTTNNVEAAGEFTKEVRELERKAQQENTTPRYLMALDRQARTPSMSNFIAYARNPKAYPKNQTVNNFLSHENAWLSFQSEQIAGLLFISVFLLLHLFCQMTEAMYMAGISNYTRTFEDNLLIFWAIASTISLWVSAVFLLGIFTNLPTKKSDGSAIAPNSGIPDVAAMQQVEVSSSVEQEETTPTEQPQVSQQAEPITNENVTNTEIQDEPAQEESKEEELVPSVIENNREIIRRAQQHSEMIVTCFHDGSDVALREEDNSILEKDDPKSTEQIDVEVNDVSQKLWFKFSAFLVIFGAMSIIAGVAGHYSIGGKIGDKEVEFAGVNTEISLKINGPEESISGKWTAKATVSASSPVPVFESYIPQQTYTKDGIRIATSFNTANKTWNFEKDKRKLTPNVNAELQPFSVYIHSKIVDNRELMGKNIPLKVYVTVQYPIRKNGQIVQKTQELEKNIELRILTDNHWIIHEISRYLMAMGIFTWIAFAIWLVILSSYLKKQKQA